MRGNSVHVQDAGYTPIPQTDSKDVEEDTDAVVPPAPEVEPQPLPVVEAVVSELRRPWAEWDLQAGYHFQDVWAAAHPTDESFSPSGLTPGISALPPAPRLLRFGSAAEGLVQHARQMLALLDLVFVPFALAFGHIYPIEDCWQVQATDCFMTICFLGLALPVRMMTSYVSVEDRAEITDPREIRRNVLRSGSFYLDAISVAAAPLLYTEWSSGLRDFSLLRLAKCWQLGRPALRDILLGNEPFVAMLAKVILAIYVIAHLFACVWFASKMHSPKGMGHEWTRWGGWPRDEFSEALDGVEVSVSQWVVLKVSYMRSLKDGVYMLTTWGGPDALSDLQLGLICLLGPASTVASGLILAQLVDITAQRRLLQTQYANRMAMVNAASDGMGLPTDLRQRIHKYHSYLALHQADEGSKDMLFGGLSMNLFAEVKLHCLRDVLSTTSFFDGLPPRLLSFLIVSFQERTFAPGDFVVKKGEIGDCLSIIIKGIVGLCITDLQTVVKVMGEGSCFGEIALVFPFPRTAWLYSASYSMMMQLSKEKFDFVLEECPNEKHIVIGRIVRSCGRLVPDLEQIVEGEDSEKAELAREVLSQIRSDFAAQHTAEKEKGNEPSTSRSQPAQTGRSSLSFKEPHEYRYEEESQDPNEEDDDKTMEEMGRRISGLASCLECHLGATMGPALSSIEDRISNIERLLGAPSTPTQGGPSESAARSAFVKRASFRKSRSCLSQEEPVVRAESRKVSGGGHPQLRMSASKMSLESLLSPQHLPSPVSPKEASTTVILRRLGSRRGSRLT